MASKNYTCADLQNAVATYCNGPEILSYRATGSMFGIPKSTLSDKVAKYASTVEAPVIAKNKGRPTLLNEEDEQVIVDWVLKMSSAGFPVTNKELLDSIQHTLNRSNRKTAFKNNRPSLTWIPRFRKRHNLSLRTPENLDLGKASVSPDDLKTWSGRVKTYLKLVVVPICTCSYTPHLLNSCCKPSPMPSKFTQHRLAQEHKLEEILKDPSRSFNSDETFMQISPGKDKVLALMGTKDVYLVHKSSEKSGVTVLATVSSSGWILPPFIVYPYERFQPWMEKSKMPPGFETFCTKKGWMTVDAFCYWLLHQFIPELKRNNIQFPVILYIDGHRSHINIRISDICAENEIVLICFPPNTTHILQPCDVALFKPLKGLWQTRVNEWTTQHPSNRVTVKNMAGLLHDVWQHLPLKYGQNGFRACGLYPWNPEAVRISKCLSKIDDQGDLSSPDNYGSIQNSDENNNLPMRFSQSSESSVQSSSLKRSANFEINPQYIGHAILAEFERKISKADIDRYVSILSEEENYGSNTALNQLSDIDKIKYDLWKGLIQEYFGNISSSTSLLKSRNEKLVLDPVPCLPGKSERKRELSSPILTGERAKKILAEQDKKKQEREKKTKKAMKLSDEEFSDCEEDLDEGYHQYMTMNGNKVPLKSSKKNRSSKTLDDFDDAQTSAPTISSLGATSKSKGKKLQKVIIEGTRKSVRLIAKTKVEEKEVVDVEKAVVFEEVLDELSQVVLCNWCKEPAAVENCNQCRVCDNFIHETCFPKAMLFKKYELPSFCCPPCVETFISNRQKAGDLK